MKNNKLIYVIAGLSITILVTGLFSTCSVVKTNYSTDPKKIATVYYYLPESILKIKATVKIAVNYTDTTLKSFTVIEQSFATTTEIIADTKDLLSLNYIPSALMADDIKYLVNSKGLLETVNITTEDRTAEIISKLAEAPKAIVTPLIAGGKSTGKSIIKIKEYTADFIVKASAVSKTPLPIIWNIVIENELSKEDYKIGNADFEISSQDLKTDTPKLSDLINGNALSKTTETEGIFTRPLKNIELEFKSAKGGFINQLKQNIVIADNTKLVIIPVNRTAFAKRVNKIGIQDGVILSNEINKPSSVEGFISIPINIAKSIVSIPAQLIQFKFDNTKRLDEFEKAKLNYEKSLQENQKFAIEAQIKLLQLQKELEDLKKELEAKKK